MIDANDASLSQTAWIDRRGVVAAVLAATIALAAIVRVFFWIGIQYTDATIYSAVAHSLATGTFALAPDAYHVRVGFIAPLAVAIRFLGLNDAGLLAYPFVCSLVLIAATYWLGALFADRKTGLLAAFFLAMLPVSIVDASDVHTDVAMAMWLALSLASLETSGRATDTSRGRAWAVVAGLCFGIAYLTKLTTVAFVPAFLFVLWRHRQCGAVWLAPLVFASVVALESAAYWTWAGSPVFRLTAEMKAGAHATQVRVLYSSRWANFASAFLEYPLLLMVPYPLRFQSQFGYQFLLLPLALIAWASGSASRRTLLIWAALIYLPLSFAIIDLATFAPAQIRAPRTLEPLLPALTVIMAFWFWRWRAATRWSAVAVIAVTACYFSFLLQADAIAGVKPLKAIVARYPVAGVLYTDVCTAGMVGYLTRYDAAVDIKLLPTTQPERGYVLINDSCLADEKKWDAYAAPAWIGQRDSWQELEREIVYERVVGGYRGRLRAQGVFGVFRVLTEMRPSDRDRVVLYRLPEPVAGRP